MNFSHMSMFSFHELEKKDARFPVFLSKINPRPCI